MSESDRVAGRRTLSEGLVAAALAIDRLELHLAAAALRLGQYDPLTHLMVFNAAEVDRIASELGRPRPRFKDEEDSVVGGVPEPSGE